MPTRSAGSLGATGTDRVDNFIVNAVPEPSAILSLVFGGGLLAWRRRRYSRN